jgi:hypothetical protein
MDKTAIQHPMAKLFAHVKEMKKEEVPASVLDVQFQFIKQVQWAKT